MTFKLPNFLNAPSLNALRGEMGAPLAATFTDKSDYVLIELPIIERLRETGVDVDFEDIHILEDGTLSYKGYRVLLYIRDIANYGGRHSLPKFHLSYCKTLETMHANKRFQRYVVANREDGLFQVNFIDEKEMAKIIHLGVCQNCLGEISWNGFKNYFDRETRSAAVNAFKLKEFFKTYPRDLHIIKPDHTSDTAPINDYTDDWGDVSERFKRSRQYICDECGIELSQRKSKYIHVHHKNGSKNDNTDSNLKLVCIRCHANEPMHGHMKRLPDYLDFIAQYP